MAIDSLFVARALISLLGLFSFYKALTLHHLVKKILAWSVFQWSLILLWLTSDYRYHGQLNPLPQNIALIVFVVSLVVGVVLLLFALGVLRRRDSFEVKEDKA